MGPFHGFLDHDDPKITRGYARLSGQRLREEFVAAARFNVAGERLDVLLPESPLTDVTWMKERLNRARVTLPNGYCSLPLQQTCEVQNACLDCSEYFMTTPEFLPAHEAQHARTAELIGAAEITGQTRIAEKNRTVLVKLETLKASLGGAVTAFLDRYRDLRRLDMHARVSRALKDLDGAGLPVNISRVAAATGVSASGFTTAPTAPRSRLCATAAAPRPRRLDRLARRPPPPRCARSSKPSVSGSSRPDPRTPSYTHSLNARWACCGSDSRDSV